MLPLPHQWVLPCLWRGQGYVLAIIATVQAAALIPAHQARRINPGRQLRATS